MRMKILQGGVFEMLPKIESESVDLVLTSPPYWGLRNYGVGAAELGAEPTMEEYLENSLRWINEVFRVLKPTGSFVLNIGDCFMGGWNNTKNEWSMANHLGRNSEKRKVLRETEKNYYRDKNFLSVSSFLYCKIIQETKFICRGEYIWCKPNVPNPIRSRLKQAHEKLFWFVKDAENYYFDKGPWMRNAIVRDGKKDFTGGIAAKNGERTTRHLAYAKLNPEKEKGTAFPKGSFHAYVPKTIERSWQVIAVGAKQSGFELTDKGFNEHIAPFPENLIRPYVKSLCPPDGTVLDPFLGSGTTMRVAMENHRNSIGIEINPEYIKYAKKRVNFGAGLGVDYEEVKPCSQ